MGPSKQLRVPGRQSAGLGSEFLKGSGLALEEYPPFGKTLILGGLVLTLKGN